MISAKSLQQRWLVVGFASAHHWRCRQSLLPCPKPSEGFDGNLCTSQSCEYWEVDKIISVLMFRLNGYTGTTCRCQKQNPGTWLKPNISIPIFQDFLGSKDLNSFFFFIFPNPGIGISVQSRDPNTRGKMSPQQTFLEEFSVYFNMNEIYWSAKSNWMAVAPMFCFYIWWVEATIRNYLVIN